MKSNRSAALSRTARADLRAILRTSEETWGREQRDTYAGVMTAALRNLAAHPNLGPSRDDLSPGLRMLAVRLHVIYYRIDGDIVRVDRILHGRMDPSGRLGE